MDVNTYICFNDESGSLFDKNREFYVRASIIVNSLQLKKIEKEIKEIRNGYNLSDLNPEIKWQDLWRLRNCFRNNKEPKDKRLREIYDFLNKAQKDYHLLIDYCESILSIIKTYNLKVILTFTPMYNCQNHKPESIIKFHIQDNLQRIQMQYSGSVVLVIYDSLFEDDKKIFKEIHKTIVKSEDFVEYNSIFTSLLFDDSYDNGLIQIADYVVGAFANVLKAVNLKDSNNYQKAIYFFKEYIYPNLAKCKKGKVWGVGIKETPKDDKIRKLYFEKIKKL